MSPRSVAQILEGLTDAEILAALRTDAAPGVDPDVAARLLKGERHRVGGLGDALWPSFYHQPLQLLRAAGVIDDSFSFCELGPSLGLHYATLPQDCAPERIVSIEHDPVTAALAKATLTRLAEKGQIASRIDLRLGDHLETVGDFDVASLSLVSQYDAGEDGTFDWLRRHSRWGINGDVLCGPLPGPSGPEVGLKLPLQSRRFPQMAPQGHWHLTQTPHAVRLGEMEVFLAPARLELNQTDPAETGLAHWLTPRRDRLDSTMMVYQTQGGAWRYVPWGYAPEGAGDSEQLRLLLLLGITLAEVYDKTIPATGIDRTWDGNAAFHLPGYAAQQGVPSISFLRAARARTRAVLPAALPISILLRYRREFSELAARGVLTTVGPDRVLRSATEALALAEGLLGGLDPSQPVVEFHAPMIMATVLNCQSQAVAHLKQVADEQWEQ